MSRELCLTGTNAVEAGVGGSEATTPSSGKGITGV